MDPDIEKLINIALADGDVTEKERGIILRKAESLGIDKDEVEMILDGKIAMMKKEQASNYNVQKSNKEGDLKKCPSCGAPVQSFTSTCSDCGHVFTNVKANSTVQKLFEELQKIEHLESTIMTHSFLDKLDSNGYKKRLAISNRQSSLISTFPIPNAKEDLLEFISLAVAESTKATNDQGLGANDGSDLIKKTWITKGEQALIKAKLICRDDSKTIDFLNECQIRIDQARKYESRKIKPVIKTLAALVVVFGFIFFMAGKEGGDVEKEKVKLNEIDMQISNAIDKKDFNKALILTDQLIWLYRPQAFKEEARQYDEKRKSLKQTITDLQNKNR
jgi:hypothetical protein